MMMPSFWIGMPVLLLAACTHPLAHSPSDTPRKSSTTHGTAINAGNVKRVVRELPPKYEVTYGMPSGASPRLIWRLEAHAGAKPPRCAALADPGNRGDQTAEGFSGSGTGGIVDVVVVTLKGPVGLEQDDVAECGRWTMSDGHTTANVHLADGPPIDGAETLGMVADTRSSVESGTEIFSSAYTFSAYLGNYYAFATLITDPGSAVPSLPPQYAADLLVKTVSALRG